MCRDMVYRLVLEQKIKENKLKFLAVFFFSFLYLLASSFLRLYLIGVTLLFTYWISFISPIHS